jgi:competence protein ComFC
MIQTTMANIHPTSILGPWSTGFALDYQIISSEFVGYNDSGHPMFDTKRTEIGELLYRLKYRRDKSVCGEIIEAIVGFLETWKPPISVIVPMPASQTRPEQPVMILADLLAKRLRVPLSNEAVAKTKKTPQLKDVTEYNRKMEILRGAFPVQAPAVSGQRILLFDDLYQTGATMASVTEVLYTSGQAAEVHALTLTRARK